MVEEKCMKAEFCKKSFNREARRELVTEHKERKKGKNKIET